MNLYTVETDHYTWNTIAANDEDAKRNLLREYAAHAAVTGADPTLMREILNDDEWNVIRNIAPGLTWKD